MWPHCAVAEQIFFDKVCAGAIKLKSIGHGLSLYNLRFHYTIPLSKLHLPPQPNPAYTQFQFATQVLLVVQNQKKKKSKNAVERKTASSAVVLTWWILHTIPTYYYHYFFQRRVKKIQIMLLVVVYPPVPIFQSFSRSRFFASIRCGESARVISLSRLLSLAHTDDLFPMSSSSSMSASTPGEG